ncbi:LysR substrate-binding domain-containing protein [Ochrobactrum teleogrylli]
MWQFFSADSRTMGIAMESRISANNGEAIRDMAIAGLGIALLPMFIARNALKSGALIDITDELKPVPLPISVVWQPVKPIPMKLRAIIDHLATGFQAGAPWLERVASA